MDKILSKLGDIGIEVGLKILYAVIILIVGSKLITILIKLIKKSKLFNKIDKSLASFLLSFIKIVLYIILGITVAGTLGVPLTSMITVLGSAGLALGLALQGGLSNIAGGITILLFKPFIVGDFIDTHEDSGTVRSISLFYTTLVTPDNKIISIPNGDLANEAIVNYSKEKKRRLDISINVSTKNDIEEVKKLLNKILEKEQRILTNETIFIGVTDYNASGLTYTIRVWVNASDFIAVKTDLLENIKKQFDKNNVTIPYQQIDVHFDK